MFIIYMKIYSSCGISIILDMRRKSILRVLYNQGCHWVFLKLLARKISRAIGRFKKNFVSLILHFFGNLTILKLLMAKMESISPTSYARLLRQKSLNLKSKYKKVSRETFVRKSHA